MTERKLPIRQQQWLPGINTGSETIPAFACVGIASAGVESEYLTSGGNPNRLIFELVKPNSSVGNFVSVGAVTASRDGYPYGFNSHLPIAAGKQGLFTLDLPAIGLSELAEDGYLNDFSFGADIAIPRAYPQDGEWYCAISTPNATVELMQVNVFMRHQLLDIDVGEGLTAAIMSRSSYA